MPYRWSPSATVGFHPILDVDLAVAAHRGCSAQARHREGDVAQQTRERQRAASHRFLVADCVARASVGQRGGNDPVRLRRQVSDSAGAPTGERHHPASVLVANQRGDRGGVRRVVALNQQRGDWAGVADAVVKGVEAVDPVARQIELHEVQLTVQRTIGCYWILWAG